LSIYSTRSLFHEYSVAMKYRWICKTINIFKKEKKWNLFIGNVRATLN